MFIRAISLLLGLLLLATSMHAQDASRVSVPFDFSVGGQKLPNSTYEIVPASNSHPDTLIIRNLNDLSQAILVNAKIDPAEGHSRLVFQRSGKSYFLVGIVTDGGRQYIPHR